MFCSVKRNLTTKLQHQKRNGTEIMSFTTIPIPFHLSKIVLMSTISIF